MTPGRPILGMGAVASVGTGVDDVFEALCAGRTGLHTLRGFDETGFRARHAYEIDDRPVPGRDVPGRATAFLIAAVEEALASAGLSEDLAGVPVLVGTGLRELRSAELWSAGKASLGPSGLHFGTALRERFAADDTHTFSNACSASLYALALGTDLLDLDEADHVVVAGVDTVTASMFGLLDRVHPEPVDAVRPFDRARRGVLMGDGAAAVVLSRDGGPPGAVRVRAVSANCDAFHVTAPDRAGIVAAVRDAHRRAGIGPSDVDVLYAHGTGTLLNDETEAAALGEVFADLRGPLVTAVKSMTGHTSGGSGLLSLVAAARTLVTGRIPPTVGLTDPVPEAARLRFVLGTETKTAEAGVAQVQAFGFGGVNAVAILEGGH